MTCIWLGCQKNPGKVPGVQKYIKGRSPVWFCEEHWNEYSELSEKERTRLHVCWGGREEA